MRSFAAIAFITAAAVVGLYVGMKKTVVDGRVLAANLMQTASKKGVTKIECEREIPIGQRGAVFKCHVAGNDGSTAHVEYTMNRAGALTAKILSSSGATQEAPMTDDADPWTD
jgi:hypothetical protein